MTTANATDVELGTKYYNNADFVNSQLMLHPIIQYKNLLGHLYSNSDYLYRMIAEIGMTDQFASTAETKASITQLLNGLKDSDDVVSGSNATSLTKLIAHISMKTSMQGAELKNLLQHIYDASAGKPLYDGLLKGFKSLPQMTNK
jgi:hypothetical protein